MPPRKANILINTGLKPGTEPVNGHAAVSTASRADGETVEAIRSPVPVGITRLKPDAGERHADWLVWQLADSAFPTGGFAHSGGLEAARQHGEVRGGESLQDYLRVSLNQLAHAAMPFVHAAFAGEILFGVIDERYDAFLSNHVANRASRLQGQAFLASAERTFEAEELKVFRHQLIAQGLPGHFAPVFGIVARLLGLEAPIAARLFVFTQLRGFISASVRLNIVGPGEGQAIQQRLTDAAEAVARLFGKITLDAAAQTTPLLDLWQGTQDRLYSRLFQT